MKKIILFVIAIPLLQNSEAQQNIAINSTGALPHSSAQLDVSSTTKGILIPRMTGTQRTAITSPATGLMVFDTDTNSFWFYNGTSWTTLAASSTSWLLGGNTGVDPSINYIGTNDNVDLRFKINTFNAGLLSNNGNVFFGWRSNNSNSTSFPNTAIGSDALFSNTTGNFNAALGNNSLRSNTTGYFNTAVGGNAMTGNTTGFENTAVGKEALLSNLTGYDNIAVGIYSLYSNTTGSNNIAMGADAMAMNTTGYSNVSIGIEALRSNTISSNLVAIGDSALFNNTAGAENTAIGSKSLYANTNGFRNTSIGFKSLYSNNGGSYNVAVGNSVMYSNINGHSNVAIGEDALYSNLMGAENTAIGPGSMYYNTAGNANTAIGSLSLSSNTTGFKNSAFGQGSLLFNTTGYYNVAVGHSSLLNNTTGYSNVAVGEQALFFNTSVSNLVAIGDSALKNNTTGTANTAIGSKALFANTGGAFNTAIGFQSLQNNQNGVSNTAVGHMALATNSSGFNTAVGTNTLLANTFGSSNVAIGNDALSANTIGQHNTAVGVISMNGNVTGSFNSSFGYGTVVYGTNLINATAIGARARVDCDNCMVLGSINGINGATSSVNVGIGTASPQQMLSVGAAMNVDQTNVNSGTVNPGLSFGSVSGEAIASKRTAGGNQYGLDFYTNSMNRMSITNSGNTGIGTNSPTSRLHVSGSESTLNGGNAAIQITNTAPGSNNTWYFRVGATGTVTPEGALSIADNGAYRFVLYNDGNAWLQGALTQNSDATLKKNVHQLSSSLNHLQQLNGYSYNWKDPSRDTAIQLGLLSQEVKKIYPGLVKENMNGELSLNYIGLIPVMIESIKEQQKQIEELKKENAEIKNMLKKNN